MASQTEKEMIWLSIVRKFSWKNCSFLNDIISNFRNGIKKTKKKKSGNRRSGKIKGFLTKFFFMYKKNMRKLILKIF